MTELALPEGWSVALVAVLRGNVRVNGKATAREAQLVVLGQSGQKFAIEATPMPSCYC
ncbi:pirin-like C-terminal cupin domain-containing protein [Methylomonas fluvii]|uniref:pirin-like C-terminal cupin domain-containing protein n=1 Tax=Methylomonas fluvii TaxID=1854564 RepID=UPI001CAA8455|nr:pirin-like C-terminal cupin domain-containing protein [Methylomonas fluvii]